MSHRHQFDGHKKTANYLLLIVLIGYGFNILNIQYIFLLLCNFFLFFLYNICIILFYLYIIVCFTPPREEKQNYVVPSKYKSTMLNIKYKSFILKDKIVLIVYLWVCNSYVSFCVFGICHVYFTCWNWHACFSVSGCRYQRSDSDQDHGVSLWGGHAGYQTGVFASVREISLHRHLCKSHTHYPIVENTSHTSDSWFVWSVCVCVHAGWHVWWL